MVSVDTISLYDYASTGRNQDSPIGTFVPLATGQKHILKTTWPLRPDYCLQMLRLHSPGFIWDGSLYVNQEDGPDESTVGDFQGFLLDMSCPPFLQADVTQYESQHKEKESSTTRHHKTQVQKGMQLIVKVMRSQSHHHTLNY